MNPAGPAITPPGADSNASESRPDAQGFSAVLAGYIAGEAELIDLRHEMSEALFERPDAVPGITAQLDQAKESGGLSTAIYRLLLRDIKRITTEETPTDPNLSKGSQPPAGTSARQAPETAATPDTPVTSGAGIAESVVAYRPSPRSPLDPSGAKESVAKNEPIGVGSILRERYELVQQVSDGSMGQVYRAIDQLNEVDATVAIKVLSPKLRDSEEALRRLKFEAFNAQRLAHPNIVNVFEIDRHGGGYFISMEWLNGESLANRLDRTRPHAMSRAEFEWVFRGLSQALVYAHEQGVVHGDVKPANVFLTDDDQVKLIDFGLARAPGDPQQASNDEQTFGLTQSYASCDVHSGEEPTAQDDVFALALIAYRMLAGNRPFGSGDAMRAETQGVQAKRPPDITDGQWKTLQAGMAFRRPNRLSSVEDLATGLLDEQPEPVHKARRIWPWAVAATVGAFAMGVWISDPVLEGVSTVRAQISPERPRTIVSPAAALVESAPAPASSASSNEVSIYVEPRDSELSEAPEVAGEPERDASVNPSGDAAPELTALPDDVPAPTIYLGNEEPLPEIAAASPVDVAPEFEAPVVAEPAAAPANYRASRPLGFLQEQYTVSESDGFIRLAIGSPASLPRPISLRIVVQEGTAMPGQDFAVPGAETVTVEPGVESAEVFVPLIADSQTEFIEDFVVRLVSLDSEFQVVNDEVLIVILDDDAAGQPQTNAN